MLNDTTYMVFQYYRRSAKGAGVRLYRRITEHTTLKSARATYEKRAASGSTVFAEVVRVRDCESLMSTGNPSCEDEWLDTEAAA
jgi:hypothetical protein